MRSNLRVTGKFVGIEQNIMIFDISYVFTLWKELLKYTKIYDHDLVTL